MQAFEAISCIQGSSRVQPAVVLAVNSHELQCAAHSSVGQPMGKPDCRLYVGNMDVGMTEGHILKLMRHHGKLTRCDFLWHVSGPKRGQPRWGTAGCKRI